MHRIRLSRRVLGSGNFGHEFIFLTCDNVHVTAPFTVSRASRDNSRPKSTSGNQVSSPANFCSQDKRTNSNGAFLTTIEKANQKDLSTNKIALTHAATNQNPSSVQQAANTNFSGRWSTNRSTGFRQSRFVSTGSMQTILDEKLSAVGGELPNFDVSFDDFRRAFGKKSTWELVRALTVLRMCAFDVVANNSLKLMSASQRVLGRTASEWLLKRTVYGQFVAGETREEIKAAVRRLHDVSVGPLLAVPMEDDIHTHHPDADRKFDENLDMILHSMVLARELDPSYPMMQLKLTALMPGDLCALVSEACPEPSQTPHVVEAVASALIGQPLDTEQVFGRAFPDPMKHHLEEGVRRLREVCKTAISQEVVAMVDAEYTYLNPCLNLLALAMMLVCNDPAHTPPLVFYTYQNYLKETREVLERDIQFLESSGIGFGAKMVRGAYMYKERQLAAQQGYDDPVHDTYDATSAAYDSAVTYVLNKMAAKPRNYRVIVASHNEKSALSAVKKMQELDIDPKAGGVFFGQLMGMADHISCSLGVNGFLARKSLPYGPVAETLPYLSRRAQENKAILTGARRERDLLRAELRSRLKFAA